MKSLLDIIGLDPSILAIKPFSTHPADDYLFMVLRHNDSSTISPYKTHLFNSTDGGYSSGHYHATMAEALIDFNSRGHI